MISGLSIIQLRKFGVALLGLLGVAAAQAYDAEVIYVFGKGEVREQKGWVQLQAKQKLDAGAVVRTSGFAQLDLLLRDNTQVKVNQNSELQIKEVSLDQTSTLALAQGQIWAQAKRFLRDATAAATTGRPAVLIQVPVGVIGVRGTDWDISVADNGATTVTVLSGEVDFSNEFGALKVLPNEQAQAQPGKAPTKVLLTRARQRVQWVTAYRAQPRRWNAAPNEELERHLKAIEAGEASTYAAAIAYLQRVALTEPAAAIVLADVYLALGRVSDAIALLQGRSDTPALALLARAYIINDEVDLARATLARARAKDSSDAELLIAQGELARFEGETALAARSYAEALAANDKNPEAWFGAGRVDAEREAVKPARRELQRALALDPRGAGYAGELGTLETFADAFADAEQIFTAALAQQDADFNTLTGLGILKLKTGKPEEALQAFLKAGLREPRYARAALWTGVAYYQLGGRGRAVEMFRRAAELDPKDPLPHMMLSMVAADGLDLGEAIAAARRAATLMPYLKSMNQLLNNQKGNANLGTSLAQFGMEDWAQAYAFNSYSPYWAGSHLFLADRYGGSFNKNSELFQGFLSDPTVFGASNTFSTLIASPGHYATVGGRLVNEDVRDRGATLSVNGYSVETLPFSYFALADRVRDQPGYVDTRVGGDIYTVGLGLKPTHELGLFLFTNSIFFDGRRTDLDQGFADTAFAHDSHRADAGLNYKFSPTSHLWFKLGSGTERNRFSGNTYSAATGDFLSQVFGSYFSPYGRIEQYATVAEQRDAQLRHSVDISAAWQLSSGIESAHQDRQIDNRVAFAPLVTPLSGRDERQSREIFLSNRYKSSDTLLLQADLARVQLTQRQHSQNSGQVGVATLFQSAFQDGSDISEWNPRLGLAWNPASKQTLRLAAQKWRRPASANTLAAVDTAGIAVDDRLVGVGGEFKRLRAQYEIESGDRSFIQAYVDHKRVRNLASVNNVASALVGDLNLEDLERLRNRSRLSLQASDLWEATPVFGAADIRSLGLAANTLWSPRLAATLRYQYNASHNIGEGFDGLQVPLLPRHLLSAGANWLPAARWQLGLNATYRSLRYTDEANSQRLDAGWNLGWRSYWESVDKRLSFEAILENLHANKRAATMHAPVLGAQLQYRY